MHVGSVAGNNKFNFSSFIYLRNLHSAPESASVVLHLRAYFLCIFYYPLGVGILFGQETSMLLWSNIELLTKLSDFGTYISFFSLIDLITVLPYLR